MELQDAEGRAFDATIGPDIDNQIDGSVAAGGLRRGEVAFEVPESTRNLRFVYDCFLCGQPAIVRLG